MVILKNNQLVLQYNEIYYKKLDYYDENVYNFC